MPWRTLTGAYLLEGPRAPFPIPLERMQLPGGEALTGAPTFYLVTPEGRVTRLYGGEPQASSVEDALYLTPIYAVVRDRLVEYVRIDVWDRVEPEVREQRVELLGLTECTTADLPFDPARVIAAHVPARLTYSFGNEHNPMNPFGRCELVIMPNGEARLQYHAPLAQARVWTGRAAPEALDQLWAALKLAGFPLVAEQRLQPDATIRTLCAETGAAQQEAMVEWHAARHLPGYDQAFAILDAIVTELSEQTVKLVPDSQSRIVSDIQRLI